MEILEDIGIISQQISMSWVEYILTHLCAGFWGMLRQFGNKPNTLETLE